MGGESWSLTAKLCDSCKTTPAILYCRADSAFLCMPCDAKVHAANKLASRHARVWMCEVCEQAPATVTCKADAAALCVTCDRDIHSANPLARRHERFPVVPFYDSAAAVAKSSVVHGQDKYFLDLEVTGDEAEEAAEAASWLLPTPNPNKIVDCPELKSADYLFNDMDPQDLDIISQTEDHRQHNHQNNQYSSGSADRVVPVHPKKLHHQAQPTIVDGFPAYDMDSSLSKTFMYNISFQSTSQSVSSSSLEVGVVPDHNAMADVSNTFAKNGVVVDAAGVPNPVSGVDREARVLRYREKRKNRKFEKTIRYASRKAYAETRPRIKGRFAKRSEIEVEDLLADASYGVVPSY